jgi:hypothetical protein
MTRIIKRLEALERANEKSRQFQGIWADYGDTQADLDAKRDLMIAEGRAHPDDKFFIICWQDWEPGVLPPGWPRKN